MFIIVSNNPVFETSKVGVTRLLAEKVSLGQRVWYTVEGIFE